MCNILALCISIYICIMYRFFIFLLCIYILYLCISLIRLKYNIRYKDKNITFYTYKKLYVYMLFICVYEFN